MIITEKRKPIMDYIIQDMKKGATLLNGRGGYTGTDTEIILSILTQRDFIKLKTFIKKTDPKAFISVNMVTEVSNANFDSSHGI